MISTTEALSTPNYNDRVHTLDAWVETLRELVGVLSPAVAVPLRLRTTEGEWLTLLSTMTKGVHVLYDEETTTDDTHITGGAYITAEAHLLMRDPGGQGSIDCGVIYSAHLNARSTM